MVTVTELEVGIMTVRVKWGIISTLLTLTNAITQVTVSDFVVRGYFRLCVPPVAFLL